MTRKWASVSVIKKTDHIPSSRDNDHTVAKFRADGDAYLFAFELARRPDIHADINLSVWVRPTDGDVPRVARSTHTVSIDPE